MKWLPIKGYEGYYEVSDMGDIKSLPRKDRFGRDVKGKILKKQINTHGYEVVILSVDGKRTKKKVHRVVAEAFIENPKNLAHVNHKDEDKTNNHFENLEWCDHAYNMRYGTKCARQRISVSKPVYQYDDNFNLVKYWEHSVEACDELGLKVDSLRASTRHNYKYKGFYWRRNKIE